VAHEFGDENEVVALADECGAEGVTQDVAGELVGQVRLVGNGAQDVVGAACAEPCAAVVE